MRRYRTGLQIIVCCCVLGPLAGQSLFSARTLDEGTPYDGQVARQVGDLVTIRVIETMTVEEKMETDHSRDNAASVGIDQVPFTARGTDGRALPGLGARSSKEFEGEGEIKGQGRMTFTISARVIDKLDNGNLVLEARRSLRINNDQKTVLLTGVCRRADIAADNVVASTKLHNFEVSVVGDGPLTRAQQQGLLGRLLDVIWPF